MLLFGDRNLSERFAAIDVTQLRARELSVQGPPSCEFLELDDPLCGGELGGDPVQCAFCDLEFTGAQSALAHMRRAHGLLKCSYTVTLANQCLCCKEIFCNRISASRHFQRSLTVGQCHTSRVYNLQVLNQPKDTACPLCAAQFETFALLQEHLRSDLFSWIRLPSPSKSYCARHGSGSATSRVHAGQTRVGQRKAAS